jgi:hypothetical protein
LINYDSFQYFLNNFVWIIDLYQYCFFISKNNHNIDDSKYHFFWFIFMIDHDRCF